MSKKSEVILESVEIGGNNLTFEVGRFAQQANASVLGRFGDTMVLATIVSGGDRDIGYFPLFVEYQEKLYAGGKIKGSRWVKREGRPSEESILNARLVDRSIRPLFPKDYKSETQVIITVLSVDSENDPDILAINTVSAALAISNIPWEGPIAAVRLGFISKNNSDEADQKEGKKSAVSSAKTGNFIVNPAHVGREQSNLDLVVSKTLDAMVMVEAGANEVSESVLLEAFNVATTETKKIIQAINNLAKKVGPEKQPVVKQETNQELVKIVNSHAQEKIEKFVKPVAKNKEKLNVYALADEISAAEPELNKSEIKDVLFDLVKKGIRKTILKTNKRHDGRKYDEIRNIQIETSLLPRTHGSAMFKRGETQALTITTLAAPSFEQWIENMEGEEKKRYMHHYNMPPFSVGEVGRLGWSSRREVGHGALAERALEPMIPSEEEFPYTIRLVSEILSSNGSSSMASVCGSSLSLMDSGVPLKKPVAGIAMGLVTEKDLTDEKAKYAILSDIQGIEDNIGDMDFKIAGTKDGVTAMQMDVKIKGITDKVLTEALKQAKLGRLHILDKMNKALPAARAQTSRFAPKIEIVKIDPEQIGEIIGPGGKIIRKIMRETGADLEVDDDGKVTISGTDLESLKKAVDWVKNITRKIVAGEEFEGTVVRIEPFGAFIELLPGKDGLLHVSKMSSEFVSDPNQLVSIGDKIKVITEIDDLGRINLKIPGLEKKQQPPRERQYPRNQQGRERRPPRRNRR